MGSMKIEEIGLLTNDVVKLADFYKKLFNIDNNSNDNIFQTILNNEITLTIYNDGKIKNNNNQNMCLAFTVSDIDYEYKRLIEMGVEIITKPTIRPWGMINMSFYDIDKNVIYFRSKIK